MAFDPLARIKPGTKVWHNPSWGDNAEVVEVLTDGNRSCEVKRESGEVMTVRRAYLFPKYVVAQ